MAATISSKVSILVTNGDALPNNRKSGSSNSGTYFVCSSKDYDEFSKFFDEDRTYIILKEKIQNYKVLFMDYFFKYKDEYVGHMDHFESYCDSIITKNNKALLNVSTRWNDVRCFMKFKDNKEFITNAFRNILYGELSEIVLEIQDGKYYIYPEINKEKIELQFDNSVDYID